LFTNMARVNFGSVSPGSWYGAVVGTPAGTQLAGCPGGIWSIGTGAGDVSAGLLLVAILLVVLLGTLVVSVAEE
jgi:hypothetical protein